MRVRALWLICLACATPFSARAVELRYKYEAGETIVYRDWLAMAFAPQAEGSDGREGRLQFRSDSLLRQQVKKADSSAYTIEIETTSNSTEVIGPDGKSEKKENLGDPERVRLTHRGKVLDRKNLGKDADEGGDTGFCTLLDEFAIVQQIFDGLLLPEGDVDPGHTWTDTIEVDLTQGHPDSTKIKVECQATFKRIVVVDGIECAELVTDFKVPLKAPKSKEAKELNLTIDGEILGHLTSYFGIELGRSVVELATIGVNGLMTMEPEGAGKTQFGGRMKVNLKTVLDRG